jgi:hypothetical protein
MANADELEGRRFLVVEDEYLIAVDLVATLESLGVEVAGRRLRSRKLFSC